MISQDIEKEQKLLSKNIQRLGSLRERFKFSIIRGTGHGVGSIVVFIIVVLIYWAIISAF